MTQTVLKRDSDGEPTLVAFDESDEERMERSAARREQEARAAEIAAAFRARR